MSDESQMRRATRSCCRQSAKCRAILGRGDEGGAQGAALRRLPGA